MRDTEIARLAGAQFNRISRDQLLALGATPSAIQHRLARGRLVFIAPGVYALPPVLAHDAWGRWSAATLTSANSILSHASAGAAWGFWSDSNAFAVVTRPGFGGPRRHGSVLVFRSRTVDGYRTTLHGIPITTVERTLLDLAAHASTRAAARGLREAIRLRLTSVERLAEVLGNHPRHRGKRPLASALARYSGLPLERARSGAEVRALELLRDAGFAPPRLNVRIAGEEADLSWPRQRLIVEIDGGPFHLDRGEDFRKQSIWELAGWHVSRIPADRLDDDPPALVRLATALDVPKTSP
jgi:very-short-patch-repair endonuclease